METKTYTDQLIDLAWQYGPKVLMALALLIVGFWVIKRMTRGFDIFMRKRKLDDSLRPFFLSLVDVGMKVVLLLVVASMVGLETTSFIAIFSALAFSIGLALQGSLGNFASGVLILLFRPYRVGDLLTVSGMAGHVAEIQIFSTILVTPQGKRIIIPNGKMTEGPIENMGYDTPVQAQISLLVDAETSLDTVRQITEEVVGRSAHAVPGRVPTVQVSGMSRDDVKIDIGCWTSGEHYNDTLDYLYEELKIAFDTQGIKLAKERRKQNV
ncbi:MAG: mechanosensitive ion channel [Saprospiraceae bacterium]|nr:mechanosensitive ion channel [Saprospiraceae bacterium]